MPSMTAPLEDRIIGNDRSASSINVMCSSIARQVGGSSSPNQTSSSSRISLSGICFRGKLLESCTRRSTSQAKESATRRSKIILPSHGRSPSVCRQHVPTQYRSPAPGPEQSGRDDREGLRLGRRALQIDPEDGGRPGGWLAHLSCWTHGLHFIASSGVPTTKSRTSCAARCIRVRSGNAGSLEPGPGRLSADRPDQARRRRILLADCVTRPPAPLGSSLLL